MATHPASGATWSVRPVAPADEEPWRELYRGYRSFYGEPDDEAAIDVVWQWLLDPDHVLSCFVAAGGDGAVGGLAHVRPFPDPLGPSTGLHLDDLFVAPGLRGQGVGRALLRFLKGHAAEHGHYVVRWITAADNTTARALYDDVAEATPWVTYDMAP
jgi:GNAT superfamily N-acetyltransferase